MTVSPAPPRSRRNHRRPPVVPVGRGDRPRNPTRGALLCLVSAVGFGLTPLFAKEAYADGVTVPTLLAARFALAGAILWLVVAARRGRAGGAPLFPTRRVLGLCVLLGAIYAAQAGTYFGALARIDASLTALLLYAYPALVAVLAIALRHESLDRRRVAALAASAVGSLLLLGGGDVGSADSLGVLLAVVTAIGYAVYLTIAAGLPAALDVLVMSAVVCTAASAALAAGGLGTGTLAAPADARGWVWVALLAVCCTVMPVACLFAGMRHVGASNGAILSCAEPLVVVLSAAIVYGERLAPVQLVGAVALGAAVLVLQTRASGAPAAVLPDAPPTVSSAGSSGRGQRTPSDT